MIEFSANEKGLRSLVSEYAQQSCAIENNPLSTTDASLVKEQLEQQVWPSILNVSELSFQEISELRLLAAQHLLPGKDPNYTNEVLNHIVVSRNITEMALANPRTPGMRISEIKYLSASMLRGTDAEILYENS